MPIKKHPERKHHYPEDKSRLAKKIWLAGLGAYGRSIDEVHQRYERMSNESHKLFDELVVKGELLQKETAERVKSRIRTGNQKLEARIEELKEKLHLANSIDQKLSKVNDKINRLHAKDGQLSL